MKDLDELYDIYQAFLDSADESLLKTDKLIALEEGKERAILEFDNGFVVELFNDPIPENHASLRCWWNNEEAQAIEIDTLEQLICEFNSRN